MVVWCAALDKTVTIVTRCLPLADIPNDLKDPEILTSSTFQLHFGLSEESIGAKDVVGYTFPLVARHRRMLVGGPAA